MSQTPILDRQQPAPAPKPARGGLSFAVGLACGLTLIAFPSAFGGVTLGWILVFCAAQVFAVLFHELGHWVAGAAMGFEFRHIVAGVLMFAKESRGYRFRLIPGRILGGGQTAMVPRKPENLRRRFAIYGAGGPAATALLFLPIALLPPGFPAAPCFFANALVAFFCWAPLIVNGVPTDAKMIIVLARRTPSSERLAAVLYLLALDTRGIRPRDWPREIVARLATPCEDALFRDTACVYLHIHARECGGLAEIAAALEQSLACAGGMRPDLRRAYFAEAAFFQGVCGRNAALARAWLDDARLVKHAIPEKDWDSRSLAAIALAEGNQKEAREQLSRAISNLDRLPGSGGSAAAARATLVALLEQSFVADAAGS